MSPERSSIAELAYQLWLQRGCPEGTEELDWMEAERQLAASERGPASPATSDPAPSYVLGSAPDGAGGTMQPDAGAAARTSPSDRRPRPGVRGRSGGRPTAATSAPENRAQSSRPKKTAEPPVDETDDGPGSAPDDTGEG
jgi:hypothetical protein